MGMDTYFRFGAFAVCKPKKVESTQNIIGCKKCKKERTGSDKFCSKCGSTIGEFKIDVIVEEPDAWEIDEVIGNALFHIEPEPKKLDAKYKDTNIWLPNKVVKFSIGSDSPDVVPINESFIKSAKEEFETKFENALNILREKYGQCEVEVGYVSYYM